MVRLCVLVLFLGNVIRAVFGQSVLTVIENLLFFRLEIPLLSQFFRLMIAMLLYLIGLNSRFKLILECHLLCWPRYLVTQVLFLLTLLGRPFDLVWEWWILIVFEVLDAWWLGFRLLSAWWWLIRQLLLLFIFMNKADIMSSLDSILLLLYVLKTVLFYI